MERNHLVTTLVAAAAIGVGVYLYFNSSSVNESSRTSPVNTNDRPTQSKEMKPVVTETKSEVTKLRNHAFVFIKPHANTPEAQDLVVSSIIHSLSSSDNT